MPTPSTKRRAADIEAEPTRDEAEREPEQQRQAVLLDQPDAFLKAAFSVFWGRDQRLFSLSIPHTPGVDEQLDGVDLDLGLLPRLPRVRMSLLVAVVAGDGTINERVCILGVFLIVLPDRNDCVNNLKGVVH